MSEHDRFDESPATAEELQAARRLADVLGGSVEVGEDLEPLAVVRLLEAVSTSGAADELATRRLRNELAARVSRRARLRSARRILPIAAAVAGVALLNVFLLRSPARPSEGVLVARQETARAAVLAVATSWAVDDAPSRRLVAVSERQWRSRLATMIDCGRFEQLAAEGAHGTVSDWEQPVSRATLAIPTPGGAS